MAKKTFHKGWLYERDGVKFAPYTLKENIIERDGTKWGENIGNNINALSDSIDDILNETIPGVEGYVGQVDERTTELENRTQYLNASESNTFFITDSNGNIALQVNGDGATGFNFITPTTDLNSLQENVSALEDTIDNIYNESLNVISEDIQILHERTKFMNAGLEENTFYITDSNGNIGMKVDSNGATSFNFITSTADLNSLQENVMTLQDDIDNIYNESLSTISGNIEALQERTKFMNAGLEEDTFYITDSNGNIGMKVDEAGVTSLEFIAGDMEIKSTVEGLLDTTSTLEDNVGNLIDRTDSLETRTQLLDASDGSGFYITDASGNIGMVVDDNGVVAHNYFIMAPDKSEIPLIGYQKVSTITI